MSDLADQFVFLAISQEPGSERIEAARWSSDDGAREFEFAVLPQRKRRATSSTVKRRAF